MADNRRSSGGGGSFSSDPLTEILRGARPVKPAGFPKHSTRISRPTGAPPATGPSLTQADGSETPSPAPRIQAGGRSAPGMRAADMSKPKMSPAQRSFTAWKTLGRVHMEPEITRRSAPPLVNFFREDPAARAFDLLRTRLMQTLKARRWNRVAISAPTAGAGTTFTAVNLALSLARIRGSRHILMDLNQRDPGVAKLLGVATGADLHGFVSGQLPVSHYLLRVSKTLALGLAPERSVGAAELLHDPDLGPRLDAMRTLLRPDVIIYDLPPVLEHDDLLAFLPNVDGVLLVSDGTETTSKQLLEAERVLKGHTRLLGVILNRARKSSVDM